MSYYQANIYFFIYVCLIVKELLKLSDPTLFWSIITFVKPGHIPNRNTRRSDCPLNM